ACFVVDCHACRSQAGQQNCPYRGRIESNILSFWRMRFGALQSHRQVQMLAKMFDDAIDLLVGHALSLCLPDAYRAGFGSESFISSFGNLYNDFQLAPRAEVKPPSHSIETKGFFAAGQGPAASILSFDTVIYQAQISRTPPSRGSSPDAPCSSPSPSTSTARPDRAGHGVSTPVPPDPSGRRRGIAPGRSRLARTAPRRCRPAGVPA